MYVTTLSFQEVIIHFVTVLTKFKPSPHRLTNHSRPLFPFFFLFFSFYPWWDHPVCVLRWETNSCIFQQVTPRLFLRHRHVRKWKKRGCSLTIEQTQEKERKGEKSVAIFLDWFRLHFTSRSGCNFFSVKLRVNQAFQPPRSPLHPVSKWTPQRRPLSKVFTLQHPRNVNLPSSPGMRRPGTLSSAQIARYSGGSVLHVFKPSTVQLSFSNFLLTFHFPADRASRFCFLIIKN